MNFRLFVSLCVFFCTHSALCMEQEETGMRALTLTRQPEQHDVPARLAALTNQSEQTLPKKILLVELCSAFEMQFPQNMNPVLKGIASCFTTPQDAEKSFFDEVKQCPALEQPCEKPISRYYPQVVQKWLTNKLSTEQVQQQLLAQTYWYTPFYYKSTAAFSPGCPAQALTPHLPTIELLALCTAQRFLCADFNSAEFELLRKKYPAALGDTGTFKPKQTYLSGPFLMCQPEFYTTAFPQEEDRKKIVFISNNQEAIAAAEKSSITCLPYAPDEQQNTLLTLHNFLVDKELVAENTLPQAFLDIRAARRAGK